MRDGKQNTGTFSIHRLAPDEWQQAADAYRLARSDEPLPAPEHGRIFAARADGEIVATVGAERVWCVNPLWVREDWRGVAIPQALMRAIEEENTERLREQLITTNPHVELLVYRAGFRCLAGSLWRRDR